jgi:hypothetical protein
MINVKQKIQLIADALYALIIACLVLPQVGFAASTAAGTSITNTANIAYSIAGVQQPPVSGTATPFTVDELIQPVMTCSSTGVKVGIPSANDVVVFNLSNNGNGQESFILSRTNVLVANIPVTYLPPYYVPDNAALYSPGLPQSATGAIFRETGLAVGFQLPGAGVVNPDAQYLAGGIVTMAAGTSQVFYVLSDTPATGVASGATGLVELTATSTTTGASVALKNQILKGLGDKGGSAIVLTPNGASTQACSYVASGMGFVLEKTVLSAQDKFGTVSSPLVCAAANQIATCSTPTGGAYLMPQTVLTYKLRAVLSGAAGAVNTATNLVIVDPIPANTTYLPGSMTFEQPSALPPVLPTPQTDVLDADKGSFDAALNQIKISLGNLAAPATVVVTFKAVIN